MLELVKYLKTPSLTSPFPFNTRGWDQFGPVRSWGGLGDNPHLLISALPALTLKQVALPPPARTHTVSPKLQLRYRGSVA